MTASEPAMALGTNSRRSGLGGATLQRAIRAAFIRPLGVDDAERCCATEQKADDQEMPGENLDRAVSDVDGIELSGGPYQVHWGAKPVGPV